MQETGWDGKITAYAYDAAGQLTQQTEYGQSKDGKGRLRPQEVPAAGKDLPETWHIHTFKRNILGQLVEKQSRKVSHHNGRSQENGISRTRFEYDLFTGNLVKARNRHSSVTLAYDVLDQLVAETTVHNGQSATVGYAYDALGNRIQTVLPDGRSINCLYYGSGHLHQINLDGETLTDIERDQLHQEISRSQGVLTSLYDYDPMGRLKNQRTVYGDNRKQSALIGGAVNRRYAYDKAGNLIQTADQRSGVLDYVYDKIGRIESATNKQTGSSEKFAFDPANNILSDKISDGLKDKGRVNNSAHLYAGNRLKEYNGTEYTYDALGNMIYRQLPNGENQYFVYNTENQLTRAEIKKTAGNTEVWEYAYDPFGRRLSKERKDKLAWVSTEPKRTHFVWDGTRLLQEYTYKGDYTYVYTDQDSYEPLAQVFLNGKDDKQYLAYFHTDQIGIPKEMTDQFGNLLWYGEYTAWGRLKKDERVYKEVHQPFRLQNQYCDQETGLHYNFFRYYEPDTGRFVNQDPIGLWGGGNLYLFALNSQTWIDALGLSRAPWGREGFDSWFDSASIAEVRNAMANPNSRDAIKGALRNGGGAHEWFPVSMAAKAKELGFTASELKGLTTPTSDVWFKDIPDPKNPGELLEGPHSTGKALPEGHSSRASSIAHNMLGDKLEGAKTKRGAIQRIRNFAERYTKGGKNSVGGCGQVKSKRK